MDTLSGDREVPRGSLGISRFFAVILFGLGGVVGLPVLLVPVVLFHGDLRGLWIVSAGGPVAWGLGWLGWVLWTGRSIPRWFMTAFGLFVLAVPVAGVVAGGGDWKEIATAVAVLGPMALPFWSALRGQPAGPTKVERDDLG